MLSWQGLEWIELRADLVNSRQLGITEHFIAKYVRESRVCE